VRRSVLCLTTLLYGRFRFQVTPLALRYPNQPGMMIVMLVTPAEHWAASSGSAGGQRRDLHEVLTLAGEVTASSSSHTGLGIRSASTAPLVSLRDLRPLTCSAVAFNLADCEDAGGESLARYRTGRRSGGELGTPGWRRQSGQGMRVGNTVRRETAGVRTALHRKTVRGSESRSYRVVIVSGSSATGMACKTGTRSSTRCGTTCLPLTATDDG
jgi:hypothetical protein